MIGFRYNLLTLCISTAFLTACTGGGGTAFSSLPQGQPTSPGAASQSRSYPLTSAAGTYDIPPLGGCNASLGLPATTVPVATRLVLASSLAPPAGTPVFGPAAQRRKQSTGTFNVYFYTTIQLSSTITFPTLPTFSVTLPTSLNPAGLQFFYAISNPAPTNGAKVQFGTQGPATVAGQLVTFAPSNTPLTLQAGKPYTIAFYAITAIAPTPSPSPTLAAKVYIANDNHTITTYAASGMQTAVTVLLDSTPYRLAVDAAGKIYAIVAEGPELPLNSKLTTYTASGTQTTPTIHLPSASSGALAVDAAGGIYITNSNNTVTKYSPAGTLIQTISGGMNDPVALAVDANGKIYVLNGGSAPAYAASITTYNANGTQTTPTITNGFNSPFAIAIGADSKIYVLNYGNSAANVGYLTTYRANGKQTSPSITGLDAPRGLAVDSNGTIYVLNVGDYPTYTNVAVILYNQQGEPMSSLTAGLFIPSGLAVR